MARSHSRRSQQIQPEKPAAPSAPADSTPPPAPPEAVEKQGMHPGFRLALAIWLVGFVALMVWMVVDLLLGLL